MGLKSSRLYLLCAACLLLIVMLVVFLAQQGPSAPEHAESYYYLKSSRAQTCVQSGSNGTNIVYIPSTELDVLAPFSKRPLHIFLTPPIDGAFEIGFWVHRLLEGIGRPMILHSAQDQAYVSDSIIFGSGHFDAIAQARSMKLRNVGVYESADETGNSRVISLYSSMDYVLRNYWFKHIFEDRELVKKVVWIPNGYRDGIGPIPPTALLPATNRTLLCNFVGSSFLGQGGLRTKSREDLVAALDKMGSPCYVEYTNGFGGKRSPMEYSVLLRDSTFTLCPWGNSKETIRLYDAMECGSIPIMLKGAEFFDLFEDPPFILLNDWSELPMIFDACEKNPASLIQRQEAVIKFWKELQLSVTQNIKTVIDHSFERTYQCTGC